MAKRVAHLSEKKLPGLNFKLKIFINFSISAENKLKLDYMTFCNNKNETISQNLTNIIFKKLGAKNQREFEKIMEDETIYFQDKLKEKLKKRNNYMGQKWLSDMIRVEIANDVYGNKKEGKVNEK